MKPLREGKDTLTRWRRADLAALSLPSSAAVVAASLCGVLAIGYGGFRLLGPPLGWLLSPDAEPFWLSLRVALAATVLAGALGLAAGCALAKGRFVGRDTLEALGSLPIILPPTVLGYYLLLLLGNQGAVARVLSAVVGHRLVFNVTGCIIAATAAAFPFCMRASRAAIEGVEPAMERAARAMGLSEWRVLLLVTLPLARRGISAGLAFGLLRALGEYGATQMVGGDIPGSTRTMSLAVADAANTPQRHTFLLVLVAMAVTGLAITARLERSRP